MRLAQTDWSLFGETALRDLDLRPVLLNLGLALILGQILSWHYLRFSPVLSNKRKLSRLFVFVAATTMLVISVVKTSLALSLGLVGALSIIRFRTPIKEPEELAYLFLSVAVGIGLGADQRLATCVLFVGILGWLALTSVRAGGSLPPRMLVHVSSALSAAGAPASSDGALKALLDEAARGGTRVDLRRVDTHGEMFDATLILDLKNSDELGALLARLRQVFPGGSVSVVEGSALD
jgi:hypothetical protein